MRIWARVSNQVKSNDEDFFFKFFSPHRVKILLKTTVYAKLPSLLV